MSEEVKAIETYYNGYRFRSRLEARWAIFFDTVGITYEYEPEGFSINGKCYLPDFYLPKFDIYAEVKPNTIEALIDVEGRCFDFVVWGGKIKALVILSEIPNPFSSELDIANFPVIYWNFNQACWGWWYWWIDGDLVDNGKNKLATRNFYYVFGGITPNDFEPDDLLYKSDIRLKAMNKTMIKQKQDDWIARKDIQSIVLKQKNFAGRELLIGYYKARTARFEHGETPQPENLSMWRKYGLDHPEECT